MSDAERDFRIKLAYACQGQIAALAGYAKCGLARDEAAARATGQ